MPVETGALTCVEVEELTCVPVEVLLCVAVVEPADAEPVELVVDALGVGAGCGAVAPLRECGGASGFGSACALWAPKATAKSTQRRTHIRPTTIPLALTP